MSNSNKKNILEVNTINHPLSMYSNNRWVKKCCSSVNNNCVRSCSCNKLLYYNNSNIFTYFDIQPDTIFRNIDSYTTLNKSYNNYYKLF